MRRWNGWGYKGVEYPVHEPAIRFVREVVGEGVRVPSLSLEELLKRLPPAKKVPFGSQEPYQRFVHSFGQSFPDWVCFRMGIPFRSPDAVVFPGSSEDVQEIVDRAKREGVLLIPYGGGTSVVGHLRVPETDRAVVSVDMAKMDRVLDVNKGVALVEAGVKGPHLEAQLARFGCTLGHFPQSFELSTLGGWVATRSSGQFSLGYGRIERMFLGGEVIAPSGRLELLPYPASATGVDLREVVLGSEGRAGIITRCYVRVSPLPEKQQVVGAFLPCDEAGVEAVREIAQRRIPLAMVRLSLSKETRCMMALTAHRWWYPLLKRYLDWRGAGGGCLLLCAAVGSSKRVRCALGELKSVLKRYHAVWLGSLPGRNWLRDRFRLPYLRNTLWELGYGVDTLETSTWWGNVLELAKRIEEALEGSFAFSHLSHVYPSGSSIYTTFIFPLSKDPEETLDRWRKMKERVSRVIVENGGVISHHHGVGEDHKPYLYREKGELGLKVMGEIYRTFDPDGIMNPGKLV